MRAILDWYYVDYGDGSWDLLIILSDCLTLPGVVVTSTIPGVGGGYSGGYTGPISGNPFYGGGYSGGNGGSSGGSSGGGGSNNGGGQDHLMGLSKILGRSFGLH